jgi:hypothetical protein
MVSEMGKLHEGVTAAFDCGRRAVWNSSTITSDVTAGARSTAVVTVLAVRLVAWT